MIKEEIKIFKNKKLLSECFTLFLLELLKVYPHIHISLSGGSTPKDLFKYWSDVNYKNVIDWNRISFFWGDERCVLPQDEMSNFGMTKKYLFDNIPNIPLENIHRICGENPPEKEAENYSKLLNSHLPIYNKIPCFELIILGIGEDGHTASIFPNQMDLWYSKKNCIVSQHPENKTKRISLSGEVINNAQHIVFLITGKNKAKIVYDIINNRDNLKNIYSSAKTYPNQGWLYWFLDEASASLLK